MHPSLSGICSLCSHIPCPCRKGPCKRKRPEAAISHRDFVALLRHPQPPAAGCANKEEKGPSEQARGPFLFLLAVRAGFEPAVRLPVRQFSKLVVSATHPSHQTTRSFEWDCKDINIFGESPNKYSKSGCSGDGRLFFILLIHVHFRSWLEG